MATIKTKFAIDQAVSVIKSGKVGLVEAIVVTRDGVFVDVMVGNSKRAWRYSEAALQTQEQAEKLARAKAAQKSKTQK